MLATSAGWAETASLQFGQAEASPAKRNRSERTVAGMRHCRQKERIRVTPGLSGRPSTQDIVRTKRGTVKPARESSDSLRQRPDDGPSMLQCRSGGSFHGCGPPRGGQLPAPAQEEWVLTDGEGGAR